MQMKTNLDKLREGCIREWDRWVVEQTCEAIEKDIEVLEEYTNIVHDGIFMVKEIKKLLRNKESEGE